MKPDPVTVPATIYGKHGEAWKLDHLPWMRKVEQDQNKEFCTIAMWIVEAAWAHFAWHSYLITVLHLRPCRGQEPPMTYLEGASHEIWVEALDPRYSRQTVLEGNIFGIRRLTPLNFAGQFIVDNDDAAAALTESTVKEIVDGHLSPDTDWRKEWIKRFGNHMVKEEYR